MHRQLFLALIGLCLMLFPSFTLAQRADIRPEDHMYRRRVVQRIDLNEKINRPMVQGITAYGERNLNAGLVSTLMKGLEVGQYAAYDPDELRTILTYEDVLDRWMSFEDARSSEEWEYAPEAEDDWLSDGEFVDPFLEEEASPGDDLAGTVATNPPSEADALPDYSNCEQVVQMVSDWIFDKNRGEMVQRPLYIQVIWTDPMEVLPERYLAVFRYEDVEEALTQATWVNRHNDAEHRSLKEALELRMYHAFITEVSGQGVSSLEEAEWRRAAITEYEHHLWSY